MPHNDNSSDSSNAEQLKRDLLYTSSALIPLLVIALLVVIAHLGTRDARTTSLLWALACLVAGVAIGFLFGIPKVLQGDKVGAGKPGAESEDQAALDGRQTSEDEYRQRVNTNLTEISDWLTKIIVGLGLVNLHKLPPQIGSLADILAFGLNSTEPGKEKGFAVALIVCFSILGFLLGYLYTRLFLAGAFERADKGRKEIERIVKRAGDSEAAAASTRGGYPTEAQLKDAARVEQLVSLNDLSMIKTQLVSLAREYERIRSVMPSPGDERTRKMTKAVAKMRALALAGYPFLEEFAASQSPGERLVAVVMLQIRPTLEKLAWLARRFSEESQFIAYHAGVALLKAVQAFSPSALDELRSAIDEAKSLAKEKLNDPEIKGVLDAAEKALSAQ